MHGGIFHLDFCISPNLTLRSWLSVFLELQSQFSLNQIGRWPVMAMMTVRADSDRNYRSEDFPQEITKAFDKQRSMNNQERERIYYRTRRPVLPPQSVSGIRP